VKDLTRLQAGVAVDGRAVGIDSLGHAHGGRLAVTIHEGRKRILRRLFGELGYKVLELKRTRIGTVALGRLPLGKWRRLTSAEIASLRNAALQAGAGVRG
jgi:pseudouridine synthase